MTLPYPDECCLCKLTSIDPHSLQWCTQGQACACRWRISVSEIGDELRDARGPPIARSLDAARFFSHITVRNLSPR